MTESLLLDFDLFDRRIVLRMLNNLTHKAKFDFSEKVIGILAAELSKKFQLPNDVISTPILVDIFINVSCRICIDTTILRSYYIGKTDVCQIISSKNLEHMVTTAIKMVCRFSNIEIELQPLVKMRFYNAIKYGIVFMIVNANFKPGVYETI